MNSFLWSVLEIAVPFIIGAILENFFSVTQRLTRAAYWMFNAKSRADLTLWVECNNTFDEIKKQVEKVFEKDLEKIRTNTNSLMEINFKEFDLAVRKHNNGIYIFNIERARDGIRDLKGDIRDFIQKIEQIKKKIHDCEIKNLSVQLYLPYYWKSIKTIKVKGYEIKNYKIEYKNEKLKSHVTVDLNKVNLSNIEMSDLIAVFDDFTSIF